MSCTLPNRASNVSSAKKQKIDSETDTIDGRLAFQHYTSTEQLVTDLRQAIAIFKNNNPPLTGQDDQSSTNELGKIEHILSQYSRDVAGADKHSLQFQGQAGEVLTLRSTVEGGGTKQLFTGLRIRADKNVDMENIDVRKLPNGLDVVEATSLNTSELVADKSIRTFGEVFRQTRNVRPLEHPKSSRGTRKNLLEFIPPVDSLTTFRKDDYRVASLSAGSWLDYSISELDSSKPLHEQLKSLKPDTQALFKSTFSSFAPSEDNASAVVSRADRSRQWYRKYGSQALGKIFDIDTTTEYPELDDDFPHLIANYIPDEVEPSYDWPEDTARGDEPDDILDEISELVQTLSSYQRLRDLDRNQLDTGSKPTSPEISIFEMLRIQLKILVDSLPPFALAKLDGDQLKELNISTNILVSTPDIMGTGQPDEYTLRKTRMAQAQQAPVQRPVSQAQPPTRNSYTSTSTSAASYNNNARSYNGNVTTTPSLPGYAQRNQHIYNTPRPNVAAGSTYSQTTTYPRAQQPYPNATIQQFQRMQQNGYSQNVPSPQAPYTPQRSGQTAYQQPMQNTSMQYTNRTNAPAQPLTNGQAYPQQPPQPQQQIQRPYSGQGQRQPSYQANPYAQVGPNATIQQAKAAVQMQQAQSQSQSQSPQPQAVQTAQQQQVQRQASGTPQPTPQRPPSALAVAANASVTGPSNNESNLRGGNDMDREIQPLRSQAAQTASTATAGA